MILTYLHVIDTYGKLSQKREMLSNKAPSLLTGAWETALNLRINAGDKNDGNA